jgi:GTP-binding protein
MRSVRSIESSDICILVIDATRGVEGQDVSIFHLIHRNKKGIVVVVNKWDLIEKETNTARQYVLAIEKNLGLYDFLPVIFVSALTKQRITKVIDTAKEVHLQQSRRISTSALNKSIMEDIKITPPKSSTSREIKIKFVTQIKTNPPMFAFFCNHPTLVQESYKRFLMNKLREHFGFAGVPLGITLKEK